ncbi:MAG: 1-acyl-sn-glycerol-3-phosphate acyltransferase [Saprospiraceae bacterium]|jgi:1-acyl-sn-glycerol-3-phosphate acyltransferase|nr:1-acyl-sn-glycerol-3-phosphate acyltransferase [Saprospiraceae bacterium]MBK6478440.1 1-acyl-sn-glycerol-3-phosphate acyltransferase [Saprospiraceae bacterium]MBK6813937.1 1-acyl-sn-glycerol-3-phosphate acyltransferase [Saprospiraceae bacterium]MBK7373371.1 1-acyl-sn-glycerol-3-phosphate acyltransferase [Saprospiraceae bacterium]MBK7437046.1 1-acyl-sn-glycerol-3-phosphate acyltransferase [Saprospiraceae bacterium]
MGKLFWNLVRQWMGWKIEGFDINSIPKALVIVAPHTSGWDVIVGLFTRGSQGTDIRFMGKHTLFKPPFGFVFRWLGGVPVDRTKNTNLVDTIAHYFKDNEVFRIAMAPEGTRKKVDQLKSGFYYMARKANVPIVMAKFDYEHKIVTYSDPFMTSEDKDADMAKVWAYFKGVKGKHPELSIT